MRRSAVPDEGSPPTAGLTAARAFENSVYGAGAPSPPSEEGGGCLHKGFEQADGGRDTPSMCENTLYRQWQKQMTAFSLGARLHLDVSSNRALSLPQSFVAAKRRQKPAPSSEGAEAAPPHTTDFPQRKKCSNRFSVNAIPCRRYNPSVFSACFTRRKASSPSTVGFRAPPVADAARKASRCRPQVRERIAEARAANGEGAEKCAQLPLHRGAAAYSARSALRLVRRVLCGF